MADDQQDRHLPASARKIQKSREDGQVPRSRDLGHFAVVATGLLVLAVASPALAGWLQDLVAHDLRFAAADLASPARMGERLSIAVLKLLLVVVPFGLLMAVAAVGANLLLGGWNWTLKPLAPKFSKLDPIGGIGRLFSKQSLVDALKSCALALVLAAIGAFYLHSHLAEFHGTLAVALPAALADASRLMLAGLGLLLVALALVAAIDVPLQRHLYLSRLKMSHREAKDEHKELEGNQEVKVKMKARMREMVQRRMMAAVPKADLVVMNPTHYAVALKYEEAKMAAPRVVAKGADLLAMQIRDLAREHKVPVLQAPMLARALYAHAEIDREIPVALYGAVAQVLAYVYQLRAAMRGDAPMPGDLPPLDVPPELDPHRRGETPADAAEEADR
ncbi:MAG TPA: flagellar biosynthesis protein FlhB [Burkholderiaceae bacterium]|nr:flagellar biosynthesis protein FlhB [Burkholderiaceae bacterium]